MSEEKKTALKFLKKYEMDLEEVDINQNVKSFLDEMQRGLEGQKSSLDMIPTFIKATADIPVNKPVIAIDAGGTNFRCASVRFNERKQPIIEDMKKFIMPGVQSEITKEEFFEAIARYIEDIADVSEKIGFCFSYPTEILPNKDGKLIRFSKEIKIKQVQGQAIGQNLNFAIKNLGVSNEKHIVILNDTVASLLGGVGHNNRVFSGYIGFILGTGTNCCYVEKNSSIKKRKDLDLMDSQIINGETGGFNKCKTGKLDVLFDKSTNNPGSQIFEKMISGAYLGPMCLLTAQTACRDGLFSKQIADEILKLTDFSTIQVDDFMCYPYGDNVLACICKKGKQRDVQVLYHIIDRIIERAAKLTAINLSAMAIKSDCDTSPDRPLCIVAEGTTFYSLKGLKSKAEFYLKQYLENEFEIYYDIIAVDNATLIGAAIAGLTN